MRMIAWCSTRIVQSLNMVNNSKRHGIGLTLNPSKTRISHTLAGDQPGMDFLGFHIRQISGRKTPVWERPPRPRNVSGTNPDHTSQGQRQRPSSGAWSDYSPGPGLASSGRNPKNSTPKSGVGHNYYRTWVSQATFSRLDHLIWVKLRRWAYRRHPHTSATWIHNRYWRRRDARDVCYTGDSTARCGSPTIMRSPACFMPRSPA